MNEAEHRVLRNNKQKIKSHLHFDASILDELEQDDTLTEYQIHTIEAEKTNEDKIKQLLNILPRRGPNAFTRFLSAIRKNSSFLAEILEAELNKELNRIAETRHEYSSNTSPSCEDVSMESLPPLNEISTEPKYVTHHDNSNELKATNYVNSRSLAQSVTSTFNSALLQQNLNSLYTKLKTHMTSNSMRELSFHSPQPVSFDMIEELLEDLFTTLDKCYNILGGKDRSASLLSLLINLKQANNELRNALKSKEEQRNKYADNIMKLENKCRDKQAQSERFKKEMENLKKENNLLQKQVKETDTKLKELEDKVKSMEDENLNVAGSYEVERDKLKCKIKELYEENDEMKLQNIKLTNEQICQKCQALNKQDSNNNAVLNPRERNSKRGTPTMTGKTAVRQADKDTRRDSHGSSLTEAEQKFLQRIQQQPNSRSQPNVYHSQTRLDVNETGRFQHNKARVQPNIYHSQSKLDAIESGRMHSNSRAGYTEQVRKTQHCQQTTGIQQGVIKGTTLSRRKAAVSRSLGFLNFQNPAMPMAFQMNGNTRLSDESKWKFFGALNHETKR